MTQTPGQRLAEQLELRFAGKTRGGRAKKQKGKSVFGRLVKRSYQTIVNWCQDKGFGLDQQELAARALGEPSDYFAAPDLVQQREKYRIAVLQKFRSHKVGKTLTEEEWRSIRSLQWPEGVTPSEVRYWGLVNVIRGLITLSELEDSIAANEHAAAVIKQSEIKEIVPRKKPPHKRGKARKRLPSNPPQ